MFVVLTIVVIGCSLLSAQNQKPPEIQKLERYLGAWNYDGEDKTPGSGGPVTVRQPDDGSLEVFSLKAIVNAKHRMRHFTSRSFRLGSSKAIVYLLGF